MVDNQPSVLFLEGRLIAFDRQIEGVPIWFSHTDQMARTVNTTTVTDSAGEFHFELPTDPVARAVVGGVSPGIIPVELGSGLLESGEVTLFYEDQLPSHIRWA